MLGDNLKVRQLKSYINEAKMEVFQPYKKYRVGAKVTRNGYDVYQCLKSVPEGSVSNSHNWIKIRQFPLEGEQFSINNN